MIRCVGTELLVTDEVLNAGIASDLRDLVLMLQALTQSLRGITDATIRETLPDNLRGAFDTTVAAWRSLPAVAPPLADAIRGVTPINLTVPALSTAFQDFSSPGISASWRIVANINTSPPLGTGLAFIWPLPGGGSFRAWFINTLAVPVNISGVSLVWMALQSPAD